MEKRKIIRRRLRKHERVRKSLSMFLVLAMLATASVSAVAFAVNSDDADTNAAYAESTYEAPPVEDGTDDAVTDGADEAAAGEDAGSADEVADEAPADAEFAEAGIVATSGQVRTVPLDLRGAPSEINAAEGWEWDAGSLELFLNGIDFNITLVSGDMLGIIVPDGTTIILANGSVNSVVTADAPGAGLNAAILGRGALTITNETGSGTSGTLNIHGGQAVSAYGIHNFSYAGAMTINGGTINASAGDAINLGWTGYSEGINNWGNFFINSGVLTATSGNASAQTYGINVAGNLFVGSAGTPTANDPLVFATSGNSLGDIAQSGSRPGHHSIGMLANELHFHNGTATAQSGTTANPNAMASAFWGWTRGITMGEFAYIQAPVNGVLGASTNAAPVPDSVVRDSEGTTVQTSAVISVRAFTVTYNGNGNTAGTAPVDNTIYSLESTATILGQGSLARAGYTFLGWALGSNATAPDYTAGDELVMTSNVTLFAVWERLPNGNGNNGGGTQGGTGTDSDSGTSGDSTTLGKLGDNSRIALSVIILLTALSAAAFALRKTDSSKIEGALA